ncbi:MAG TPA: hypothetical protein VJ729_13040 [Nitrososphaeraceae archaeon]|nr:hypothetical protein [Nitrososphaeraceae archaeon]
MQFHASKIVFVTDGFAFVSLLRLKAGLEKGILNLYSVSHVTIVINYPNFIGFTRIVFSGIIWNNVNKHIIKSNVEAR